VNIYGGQNVVETIGITTARANSSSIPHKNTVMVAGKPLIAWTFDEVKKCKNISKYYVLTDDDDVKFIARQRGIDVIDEPPELAKGDVGPTELLGYAMDQIAHYTNCLVADIRATNPTKLALDIDGMINDITYAPDSDMICGVTRVFDHHPSRIKHVVGGYLTDFFPETSDQRQYLFPVAYVRNGSAYVLRYEGLTRGVNQRTSKKIKPWVMPPERSVNIDEPADILVAEYYLRKRNGL
jgi:CMP-N,N'-diacetyllegionaminic acid synthase